MGAERVANDFPILNSIQFRCDLIFKKLSLLLGRCHMHCIRAGSQNWLRSHGVTQLLGAVSLNMRRTRVFESLKF